jgi:hypothetical protein
MKPVVIRRDRHASALGPTLCERFIMIGEGVLARLRFAKTEIQNWLTVENAGRAIIEKIAAPINN